ncbi:regulator of nonsense transcripts 3B isoform X1 [Plodia interpunctella]|uniref:regulator of nonsense transcripts 3B isoform X1 n=1 Tax=Plodia interpunctella TaxID=58824 RepID=UPI002368E152|nr:regulator of nonsense transcripts 3B isoform X1 [Plodia interpunctella]
MTEDQDAKDSQSDSGSKNFASKNKDKKIKPQRPLTKIVLRRLPPSMTEEAFLEQVSPIPEHDHFYFAKPDTSLGHNVYSRAYINFVNVEDIYLFRDKFDGYIFLDEKGVEYVGIVEYALFQRIPKKKKKKDPKCGTIESDPIYQEFIESLTKDPESENQPKLEFSYPVNDGNDKKVQSTPLLEYLAARKQNKSGRDERRRRENDKRKMRIERKTKEMPIKEEETGEEVKKIKSREWEKEKSSTDLKDDSSRSEIKDGAIYESKTYREQRKAGNNAVIDKKVKKTEGDKKEISGKDVEQDEDSDRGFKRDKRDKFKESPRESKSKKYSDTRKERIKQTEFVKSEKQSVINKIISSDGKSKSLNHDDIKPFTQLPQVKTDDLTKIIEGMDKKMKLEEAQKEHMPDNVSAVSAKTRRSSLESGEMTTKDESVLKRQKSLDDRSKSTDREGSEEKEKSESGDRRTERRIRNKDRPSMVIYQPGMGKFSKQRLAKEKDTQPQTAAKPVNDSEKKDT